MYIYLKRLRKVKKDKCRSSKSKKTQNAAVIEEVDLSHHSMPAGSSYLVSDELDNLIEAEVTTSTEIQVLTAEDVKSELNESYNSSFEAEEIDIPAPTPAATPFRAPTGEIIFLKKLKKVRKPKKSKQKT